MLHGLCVAQMYKYSTYLGFHLKQFTTHIVYLYHSIPRTTFNLLLFPLQVEPNYYVSYTSLSYNNCLLYSKKAHFIGLELSLFLSLAAC